MLIETFFFVRHFVNLRQTFYLRLHLYVEKYCKGQNLAKCYMKAYGKVIRLLVILENNYLVIKIISKTTNNKAIAAKSVSNTY